MPSIEEKIAELTTEIGGIDVSGVELSARPGVITYKDRLQKEELLLRGSAVKEDDKRAWRHVFDHLQQSQKEGTMAVTLPFTGSPQVRQRWETVKFVWRGCFADCEKTLFSDPIAAAPVFGLVGPQGFGKTVLLRYLHAKYAFSDEYLVVHVPFMPVEPDLGGAQQCMKAAFYAACSLRDLPYEDMSHAGSLSDFICGITLFAENQGLTLLIILDQLLVSDNVKNLMDAILLGMGNYKGPKSPRVIISSSTSHTSSEVFGASVHLHLRFENFTTAGEAEALAQGTAVDASNLRNVSFLEAVRRCQSGKRCITVLGKVARERK